MEKIDNTKDDLSSIQISTRSSMESSQHSEPIFEEKQDQGLPLQYGPNDIPKWYKAIPLGFQVIFQL